MWKAWSQFRIEQNAERCVKSFMEFQIKPLARREVPVLLELIKELASFERLEDELQATVRSLSSSLLGPNRVASALLGRCSGEPAGYAIYFFTFSSFIGRRGLWLEDLYVRPEFRGKGLGKALLRAVAQVAAGHNCGRFEWTALDWNKPALEFYDGLGAAAMDEWILLRMNSEGLRRLARKRGGRRR
jgi:GNAT superfamily N-acetyltransferase